MHTNVLPISALKPIAVGLGIALSAHAFAGDHVASRIVHLAAPNREPHFPNGIFVVKNCADSGPDSLRDAIYSANAAAMDSSIEFDVSAMMGCSTITLSTGEIGITLDNLTIDGPVSQTITIDGGAGQGRTNRIFHHTGSGMLRLNHLALENAAYHVPVGNVLAGGGCISSAGEVTVDHIKISGCIVSSDSASAAGGAVYAKGNVFLTNSVVSGNQVMSSANTACGGAIYTLADVIAIDDTFSNNSAMAANNSRADGGAIDAAFGSVDMISSTVDHNTALAGAAIFLSDSGYISNSTISTNTAEDRAAIYCFGCTVLDVWNSTIAFNKTINPSYTGGISFFGTFSSSELHLSSSIVARNLSGGAQGVPNDIFIPQNLGLLSGSMNVVMASNTSPPGVIVSSDDPVLQPLQPNGGSTQTHQLSTNSPAIATGAAASGMLTDQRGRGYPRWTGASYAVDIGAVQFDKIFYGDFDDN